MNEALKKAEDYLRRAEQGFYTELGEGDRLLKTIVEKVKAFLHGTTEEPTKEPVAEEPTPVNPTQEPTPEEPAQEPTAEAQAEPAPIPEAGPAPETTSAPDEAPKA
jgi:hypothetical protein